MKPKQAITFAVFVLSLFLMIGAALYAAERSGGATTWREAGYLWNVRITGTDELLLCINYSTVAGSLAYGAGDKKEGQSFIDISQGFEAALRDLHGKETADLLINATTAVMLNVLELAGEPTQHDEWDVANLYRCRDVAERLEDGNLSP